MKELRTKRARPGTRKPLDVEASTPLAIAAEQQHFEREHGTSGPSLDEIARRAHELFLSRGAAHGHDLDDWLEAERQIRFVPSHNL